MQRTDNLGLYTVGDSEEFAYQQLINENMETIDGLGTSYIVERQRYGDYWFVERFSDKYCRCVLRQYLSGIATTTADGGVWRSTDSTYPLPKTFSAIQHVGASVDCNSAAMWSSIKVVGVDKVAVCFLSGTSGTRACHLNVTVEGWLP